MGVRIIILVGLSLLTSLVIGLFVTYLTIKVLKMKNAGQNIRDEGPESHKQKAGTPSMGGIAIIVTTFITIFIYSGFTKTSIGILLSGIMFGAVGFLDDILKIRKAHNEGLTSKQKFLLQIIIGLGLSIYFAVCLDSHMGLYLPISKITVNLSVFFIPFVTFIFVAMVNAVNLTDGLDGDYGDRESVV